LKPELDVSPMPMSSPTKRRTALGRAGMAKPGSLKLVDVDVSMAATASKATTGSRLTVVANLPEV